MSPLPTPLHSRVPSLRGWRVFALAQFGRGAFIPRAHFNASAALRSSAASHSSVVAADAKARIKKERTARLAQVVCDVFGMNALHVFFAPTGYSNRFKEHDLA